MTMKPSWLDIPQLSLALKHPFTKQFFPEWEKETICAWFCW